MDLPTKNARKTPFVIPKEHLIINTSEEIGRGSFGTVFKGTLLTQISIAVKVLHDKEKKKEFDKEALIGANIDVHPNVLAFIGTSIFLKTNQPCLVLEYCGNGCLLQFISDRRNSFVNEIVDSPYVNRTDFAPAKGIQLDSDTLSTTLLLSFAIQIARGMVHIFASESTVHRDLAARNVLLTSNLTCRVADFGLARSSNFYTQSTGTAQKWPYKWMSIEAMEYHLFSEKSDVWSFGILLYELFTLGADPYPGEDPAHLLRFLKDGGRLSKPKFCPREIFKLMEQCWEQEPVDRPSFATCYDELRVFMMEFRSQHLVELDAKLVEEGISQNEYFIFLSEFDR